MRRRSHTLLLWTVQVYFLSPLFFSSFFFLLHRFIWSFAGQEDVDLQLGLLLIFRSFSLLFYFWHQSHTLLTHRISIFFPSLFLFFSPSNCISFFLSNRSSHNKYPSTKSITNVANITFKLLYRIAFYLHLHFSPNTYRISLLQVYVLTFFFVYTWLYAAIYVQWNKGLFVFEERKKKVCA